jgi:Lysylphosphatidylglycerol synthase TM region
MTTRHVRTVGIAAAVGGMLLLTWSIRGAGAAAVVDGVKRLGAGLAIVWLLGGLRHFVRATAWRLCLDHPGDLALGASLAAYVSGDAVGNVTPFGFLISEPSKIVLVRRRVAASTSIPALALENLFYSATVAVMLAAGTAALLLSFDVARPIRLASLAILASTAAAAGLTTWIVATRYRIASDVADRIGMHASDVRATEDRVFTFAGRHRHRVWAILALECIYHASAVFEIWFALTLITGTAPSLLSAFVLEAINRTITTVFQFVPMWIGVDEAGTGLMTMALGLGPAAGVALALVRKARVMTWTGIGLVLLVRSASPADQSGVVDA